VRLKSTAPLGQKWKWSGPPAPKLVPHQQPCRHGSADSKIETHRGVQGSLDGQNEQARSTGKKAVAACRIPKDGIILWWGKGHPLLREFSARQSCIS
jgi:hypothetical protein